MIYTGLNNTGEVDAVYLSKRLTFSGEPPLSFPSKGYDLEDYLISGNTLQNGVPSPDNPVDVVGVGERTGNLFDKNTMTANAYLSQSDGQYLASAAQSYSCIIKIEPRTSYRVRTGSRAMRIAFFTQYPQPNDIPTAYYNHDVFDSYVPRAFIETSGNTDRYMVVFCYNNSWEYADGKTFDEIMSTVMVSKGAEMSVPYEPYGYKLTPTVNGTLYPIYLGQVPTTRKVKKLVLTGEENWGINAPTKVFYCGISQALIRAGVTTSACTHYKALENLDNYSYLHDNSCCIRWNDSVLWIRDLSRSNADDFKSYLQQQYAAGHPVTVWYVLAEPETGIVNEPLHKIGDYADTVSMIQSGITIPTTKGENILTVPTTVLPSSVSVTTPSIEVSEVYGDINYQKPIYYKKRTLIGVPPLNYKALSNPLSDYLISGNTIQNGTPSPDMPVDVVGCGVRTGNLIDIEQYNEKCVSKSSDGSYFATFYLEWGWCIPTEIGKTYTVSISVMNEYKDATNLEIALCKGYRTSYPLEDGTYGISIKNVETYQVHTRTFNFTATDEWLTIVGYRTHIYSIMINEGSTPLPYEPYGYKIPVTIGNTTTPIYIGSEPLHRIGEYADYVDYASGKIVRRIKKLVLTGEENYNEISGVAPFQLYLPINRINDPPNVLSNFFQGIPRDNTWRNHDHFVSAYVSYSSVVFRDIRFSDIESFVAWVAQQYAAGTPVTVWYVLQEPIEEDPPVPFPELTTLSGTNTLLVDATVKPSSMSITGNIKPTGYGQLLDVNNVEIYDKNNIPVFITG